MPAYLTEDQVRDSDRTALGFDKTEPGVRQGTGQLTTFNQLGIKGDANKPDGWYLPDNKNDVAIILETKNSGESVETKKWLDEIKKNCLIVMDAGWKKVVGILHNGYRTAGFLNNQPLTIPDEIMGKQYYIRLAVGRPLDKGKIYTITARINDCLHTEFGIKNLYHRMIFTACALVAERYGANLANVKNMGYSVFQTAVSSTLARELRDDKQKILLDVYSEIRMNTQENQSAINSFIDNVCEISDCINSCEWRGEDVMGIFFNEFNRYKKKSDAGQVFTPEHITSFMYHLIDVHADDYVLDACCGSGGFLVKALSNMTMEAGGYDTDKAKDVRENHLFGIEFDREIYALACANLIIHKDGRTNLKQMDTRSQEAAAWMKSKPITKVLMNPPYENKYGCIEIVGNVLDSVKPGTDCAFILPDKKLEKVSKAAVKRILSRHKLTEIIKLPEPLFFGIGVTTSIFVFKAGVPQNGQKIFGCYMEDDGLETVKNQGRHDVKGKWNDIEKYWLNVCLTKHDEKYHTDQWIDPAERLSYQMPEAPLEITEEDFMKTAMDYLMFRKDIDSREFGEKLLNAALYSPGGYGSAA